MISSITRAATRRDGEVLNVLTFPTHESYESSLCQATGHNFYAFRNSQLKDWNAVYRPLPSNYTLLSKDKGIPPDLDFDIVLSQTKFGQFELAKRFSEAWRIPLVTIEHTAPPPFWNSTHLAELKKMRGDVNAFISKYSIGAWGWDDVEDVMVVEHGVDTDLFAPSPLIPRGAHLLSVVNDWVNRDWCCGYKYWRQATEGLPVAVLGDTPGLSKPAANVHELVSAYQQSLIFVNTSLISPIPSVVLEAMSTSCCVVSTNTCSLPDIIEDGVNGFLCESPQEMRAKLEFLLKEENRELCVRVGENARKTIMERFNLEKFGSAWNDVFDIAIRNA